MLLQTLYILDASALSEQLINVQKKVCQFVWCTIAMDSQSRASSDARNSKEEFVMYEQNDVLDDLRDHAIRTLGHDNLPDVQQRIT